MRSPSSSAGLASYTRTRAPCRASTGAAALPVAAAPMIPISCPAKSDIRLAPIDDEQGGRGTRGAGDRKAGHDARLGPVAQLEMMVEGRHLEDPLPPGLERDHLQG